jgi:exonuclease III
MKRVLCLLLILNTAALTAQVEDIKVMTYNLLYYKAGSGAPCSHNRTAAQRDADLRTIVENVQPDIFCVNELGAGVINPLLIVDNILNINLVSHYKSANSTNNSSSSIVNMLFYNKNKFTLQSQSNVQRDLNNFPITRIIDFYRLYVNDAGLGQPGVDTVFFTIAVGHLKAGSSASDRLQRENAAKAVMDYIENTVPDDNIILTGDFNIRSSSETSYQEFTNYSNVNVALVDPINTPGSWNNNGTYTSVHTQSTHSSGSGCFAGGGMDDRFDFSLTSKAIINGSDNLIYKNYYALGQDGSFFNSAMNTNSNLSVNSTVASALYNFSDHLPVILELEAAVSGIGISERELWQKTLQIANPFGDKLALKFRNNNPLNQVNLKVLDLTGRLILQKEYNYIPAMADLEFDSSQWKPGIYLVSLSQQNGQTVSRKLVKQ